ncbi:MAG: hypothetical protein WC736_15410 [Gallionella sp.]|jgi:hypothetical protein
MGFSVIDGPSRTQWFESSGTNTYYVGQLVAYTQASKAATAGCVVPLAVPAGLCDATNTQVIAGVVTGFNLRTGGSYSSTSLSSTATGVTAQADQLARDWALNGMGYAIGDPQLLIQVTLINDWTLIRGPVYAAAVGTAPTLLTNTESGETTGGTTAITVNTIPYTNIAALSTLYVRTGANAGLHRVTASTSTTEPAVTHAFPYDFAVGDTMVQVPFKKGFSKIYVSGPGLYVNSNQTPDANYFGAIVEAFELSTAGRESVSFRFTPEHFSFVRASS